MLSTFFFKELRVLNLHHLIKSYREKETVIIHSWGNKNSESLKIVRTQVSTLARKSKIFIDNSVKFTLIKNSMCNIHKYIFSNEG